MSKVLAAHLPFLLFLQFWQLSSGRLLAAGSALEPTLVLANHSCEPALLRVNVEGRATVAFAARDLKEGDEV